MTEALALRAAVLAQADVAAMLGASSVPQDEADRWHGIARSLRAAVLAFDLAACGGDGCVSVHAQVYPTPAFPVNAK